MPGSVSQNLKNKLLAAGDRKKSVSFAKYFKTGKGQYGEGDIFLGIAVPVQRKIALEHAAIPLPQLRFFLQSKIHEFRFTALEILVSKYKAAPAKEKAALVKFYLNNLDCVNNWDLVDTSAPQILGSFLLNKDKKILMRLAHSKNYWHRRVAVVSTLALIRSGSHGDALEIIAFLLSEKQHDLINKAMGWMLREIGDCSRQTELAFLRKYSKNLPKITLRYACEHLPKHLWRGLAKPKSSAA